MTPRSSGGSGSPAPAHIDRTKASIARVYDAGLGGKDNYEVDRQVVQRLRDVAPEIEPLALENRAFLLRVTRFIAGQAGITQFLDCGSGLPTAQNTHQVAQHMRPEAKVVYVDNDPSVIAYGRALLEENEQTRLVAADIFTPRDVLDNEIVRNHLDFAKPIALFQLGTLHHHGGLPQLVDIMQEYVDALPSGSYVAISHFLDPEDEYSALARRLEQAFVHSPLGKGTFRTHSEIAAMFAGLELIEPGVVRCVDWWPDGPRMLPLVPAQRCIAGAVARKP